MTMDPKHNESTDPRRNQSSPDEGGPAGGYKGNAWTGMDEAWGVVSLLLSGLIVCGGIGWGLDWLAGFHYLFLPIGVLAGLGVGTYLVMVRYGGLESPKKKD